MASAKPQMAAALQDPDLFPKRAGSRKRLSTPRAIVTYFAVLGVGGGEIMGAVRIAMIAALSFTALRDAILAHPTLLEGGLAPLFSKVPPLAGWNPENRHERGLRANYDRSARRHQSAVGEASAPSLP